MGLLPAGSGSLATESSRRHRLNVSDWQAWCDNTHLEDIKRKAFETASVHASRDDGDVRLTAALFSEAA